MTSHRFHDPDAGRWTTRRKKIVAVSLAAVMTAIIGTAAVASANDPEELTTLCTGSTPDAAGNLVLNCIIPMPAPGTVTVTTPVPTTVTETVTVTPSSTTPAPTTPVPTTPAPTTPAPTTTAPTTTPPPVLGKFPTATSAGLPAGWAPKRTITGDYTIRTPGTVIEDTKFVGGTIYIRAANVTLRRIQGVGAFINNDDNNVCRNGLVVEDSSFTRGTATTRDTDPGVVSHGGYILRNVSIDNVPEGLRVGGRSIMKCGPVEIYNTFIRIVPPDVCNDWHGDGIQAYDGDRLKVRNTTIIMVETGGCYGTAPFFYPDQWNVSIDVDGLIVSGGGYSFRDEMPGTVRNLNIVNGNWGYGPIDVTCSLITSWDAKIVTLDAAGQPVFVRNQPCN